MVPHIIPQCPVNEREQYDWHEEQQVASTPRLRLIDSHVPPIASPAKSPAFRALSTMMLST
jgi:hypothetical protein